jgi:spore maturation protein CgeB
MRILFHLPNPHTIYAGRSIYNGYKNAFIDLGHDFRTLESNSKLEETLSDFQPEIFFMSLSSYSLRGLDLTALEKYRKAGLKVFVSAPFWKHAFATVRINEDVCISKNPFLLDFIRSGKYADVYYNVCEQGDPRMEGFDEATGYHCYTMPLAADKIVLKGSFKDKFKADVSYIGTNLPEKRPFFRDQVVPLKAKYDVKLYGQDWTRLDSLLGWVQRFGQYFDLPYLRNIRKPKLQLEDEACVYFSSLISINVHEEYQKKYGNDCNERTFKIPVSGGFEITDNVSCIKKYFEEEKEIIIAYDKKDWFEKIDYYVKNPDMRIKIIEEGKARVLRDHTYHNRVKAMLDIYAGL